MPNEMPMTILLCFLAIIAATVPPSVAATGLHRSAWGSLVAAARVNTSEFTGSRTAALSHLIDGDNAAFYIDIGMPPASLQGRVVGLPLAAVGIAVGFNLGPGRDGMQLTIDELGWLLRGDRNVPFDVRLRGGVTVPSSAVRPVLTRDSGLLAIIAATVREKKLTAPSIGADFEAKVSANPSVVWVTSMEDAVNVTSSTQGTITLTTFAAAISVRLRVAALTVAHPKYAAEGLHVATFPRFGAGGELLTQSADGTIVIRSEQEPTYPLVAPVVLAVSVAHTCSVDAKEWTSVYAALLSLPVAEWGLKALPASIINSMLATATRVACHTMNIVAGIGTSAIDDLVPQLGIAYYLQQSADPSARSPPLVLYNASGSSAGIAAIKSGSHPLTGTDSLFTEAESAQNPDVKFVPFTAFAVALPFNIPGVRSLVLPRCVAVAIFNGRIQYRDDPRITRYNPTELLVHEHIVVVFRGDRSGTTEAFLTGLHSIDETCNGTTNDTTITISSLWNLAVPGSLSANSTSASLNTVLSTAYSIGYASAGAATARGIDVATLLDERTQSTTPPTLPFVRRALEAARIDIRTMYISFVNDSQSYPLVGASYVMYNARTSTSASQNVALSKRLESCSTMRAVLDWVEWCLANETAATMSRELNFEPIPSSMLRPIQIMLRRATCDDVAILPPLPTLQPLNSGEDDNGATTTTIVAVVVSVVVLALVGAAIAVHRMCMKPQRDTQHAPKDASKPFTIVFTDIQSSTSLWARVPEVMGPALDTHNAMILELIKKHRGYHIKWIGDSAMIAFESADDAVNLCEELQWAFFRHDWGSEAIDEVYRQLEQEALEDDPSSPKAVTCHLPDALYTRSWNGLRVRCGIHTGIGEIKFDPVAFTYDYYGSVCNVAARVESVANGGQVCMTATTAAALTSSDRTATSLGAVPLRGLSDPIELLQIDVVPGRKFAPLRLERGQGSWDANDQQQNTAGDKALFGGDSSSFSVPEENSMIGSSVGMTRSVVTDNRSAVSGHTGCESEGGGRETSADTAHTAATSNAKAKAGRFPVADTIAALFHAVDATEKSRMLSKLCATWRVTVSGHHSDSGSGSGTSHDGEADKAVAALSERIGRILAVQAQNRGNRKRSGGSNGALNDNNSTASGQDARSVLSNTSGRQSLYLSSANGGGAMLPGVVADE